MTGKRLTLHQTVNISSILKNVSRFSKGISKVIENYPDKGTVNSNVLPFPSLLL
jgi:hypothetical protein